VTFADPMRLGALVKFTTLRTNGITTSSAVVTYEPAGAGAVATTVQAKLRESVSVLDFIPIEFHAGIADGTSTTPVDTYIQAALDSAGSVIVPVGTYIISAPLVMVSGNRMIGTGGQPTIRKTTATLGSGSSLARAGSVTDSYAKDAILIIKAPDNNYAYAVEIENIYFVKTSIGANSYGIFAPRLSQYVFRKLYIQNVTYGFMTHDAWMGVMERVTVQACSIGYYWQNDGSGNSSGTSLDMRNCWINFDKTVVAPAYGFFFYGLHYSTLTACGCDNGNPDSGSFRAYRVHLCRGMAINGCGAENYRGGALEFEGSSASVNGFSSFTQTGNTSGTIGTMFFSDSTVTLTALQFEVTTDPGAIYNQVIQNNSHVVYVNPRNLPSGGASFVSYSSGSTLVSINTGVVTKTTSSGTINLDTLSSDVAALKLTSWDAFGTGTITGGVVELLHGLGVTPSYVMARIVHGSNATLDKMAQVTGKTSVSFTVRPITLSTGAADFGNYTIEWWAKK